MFIDWISQTKSESDLFLYIRNLSYEGKILIPMNLWNVPDPRPIWEKKSKSIFGVE